jgi:hypothetical protein
MRRTDARLKTIEKKAFPAGIALPPLAVTVSCVEAVYDKSGKQTGLRTLRKTTVDMETNDTGEIDNEHNE